MRAPPVFDAIEGSPVNSEQRNYLDGFFHGLAAKGVALTDGPAPGPGAVNDEAPPIREERIKREEHPLDSFYRLHANARSNRAPDKDDVFRFKWNGLFFLSPVKDAYMARLRIPGGRLKAFQLREVAAISRELTSGYIQVTTRANLQLRLVAPKDAPEFLRRLEAVGLTTRGSGADNIRNLTTNPTAGIDPHELIDCHPLVQELAQFILQHREFYDLPRKFNVAFDGGGLIGSVEDTNDIGVRAVRTDGGVHFRVAVGGATGHKAFARDLGILVAPDAVVAVVIAMIRVYIAHGDRTDRKRARLKHLLENWTLERFVSETEKLLGEKLEQVTPGAGEEPAAQAVPHSHIGAYPQRQPGLSYLGVALAVGQVTAEQLDGVARIAERYGSGEIRLTVWQNFIIPNLPDSSIAAVTHELWSLGLDCRQSHVASGVIACTGNRYCKYSSTDTKGHAQELVRHLEGTVALDTPVNIHFTGCPHSCAQHYMGDIGLLGAKAADGREAYTICVGGGFGANQAVGRQVFAAVPFEEVKPMVERILNRYLQERAEGQTFGEYAQGLDSGALEEAFGR
jgi:ferredoxin-nitrite reductase